MSEQEWQNFVDTVVSPRFDQGLTLFDADGQYLMDDGTLIREEYKQRFSQEAVLRIDDVSCVAF